MGPADERFKISYPPCCFTEECRVLGFVLADPLPLVSFKHADSLAPTAVKHDNVVFRKIRNRPVVIADADPDKSSPGGYSYPTPELRK